MAGNLIDMVVFTWAADGEVLPTADGWTTFGTGTQTLTDDGVRISASAASYGYTRRIDHHDTGTRITDSLYLQAQVRGVSQSPDWGGGDTPTIGLAVSDGDRQLALVIGDHLALVDVGTGQILLESSDGFPWLQPVTVRLQKIGTVAWEVWVGGRKVLEVPYQWAPQISPPERAKVSIGLLDPAGTGVVVLDQLEVSANIPLPEGYLAEQYAATFPTVVRDVWNSVHRAFIRTAVSAAAWAWSVATEFARDRTAGRVVVENYEATGLRDPQTQPDPWTVTDPGEFDLVRDRMQLVSPGSGNGILKDLSTDPSPPPDSQWSLKAEGLIVRSYTADAFDHVGPALRVVNNARELIAVLWFDGTSARWSLTDSVDGPVVELGEPGWIVDPEQPHDVEVRLFGAAYAVLIVDGRVVNRVPAGELPAASTDALVELRTATGTGVMCEMELDRLVGDVRCADNRPRATFARALQERLLPVGGCERNDELETWRECLQGTLAARGTGLGILLEMRRLCCSEDCFLIEEGVPLSWVVGLSFPGITPVVIQGMGDVKEIYVEFSWGPPAFGLQAVADWIAYHLVPMSTPAVTFHICLITKITGSPSTPSAGVRRFPVITAKHFAVGDTVTIRDGATPTTHDDVEVVAVGTDTIDVTVPPRVYGSNDFIRKEIRTS
jgi:hypothetical protein